MSISSRSFYRPILDAFIRKEFVLCVTTDILLEYEEIIRQQMGERASKFAMELIENASNVELITKYFKWNLIEADADDNKFVDCAIACNAKFIVSNDKHFNILGTIPFPKVEVNKADTFKELL